MFQSSGPSTDVPVGVRGRKIVFCIFVIPKRLCLNSTWLPTRLNSIMLGDVTDACVVWRAINVLQLSSTFPKELQKPCMYEIIHRHYFFLFIPISAILRADR